tara:strand:- start:24561 stop:24872 length:312 start_codon:yes stop_codon:yes gene_type:complete
MKEKILTLYKKLPSWSKNRYFISFLFFFIWIFFFDTNSILTQIDQKQEIKKLKKDKEYYEQEIKKDKDIINILSQDSLTPQLEQYLREKLFLSKENEEVFIIE